jgi:hypothetical protein
MNRAPQRPLTVGNRFRGFRNRFGRVASAAGRGLAAGAGMAGRGLAAGAGMAGRGLVTAGKYGATQASRAYATAAPRIAAAARNARNATVAGAQRIGTAAGAARNRALTAVRNATIFRNSAANAKALTILLRNGGVANLKNKLPYSDVRARANTYLRNKGEQPLGAMTSACDVIHRVSRTLVAVNSPSANANAAKQIAGEAVVAAQTVNTISTVAPNNRQVNQALVQVNKAANGSVNAARQGNLPKAAEQLVKVNNAAAVVVNEANKQMVGQAVGAANAAMRVAAVAPNNKRVVVAANQAVASANQAVVAARQGNVPVVAAAAANATKAANRALVAAPKA